MSYPVREKSCGAVVYRRENDQIQTLIIRHNQGHWGLPKGHIENAENEMETALREVEEETGFMTSLDPGFREETHYSPKSGVQKEVVYFLATPVSGSEHPDHSEISEVKWVGIMDAQAILTYENDAAMLRKAYRYIKENLTEDNQ